MDWLKNYEDKKLTAQDAVGRLRPETRIFIGSGSAEPVTLVDALVEHGTHLYHNDIVHLLTLGPADYCNPEYRERFRHQAFFIGANVREAVQECRADFMPVFLSEIPELMRTGRQRIDAALIQVSPPDDKGYCTLGVSVDVVRAAVDSAWLVIAEVNPQLPRTYGDTVIHVTDIDYVVEVDYPLIELPAAPLDDLTLQIGRNVAKLIPNEATLQVGIGGIPDAVMRALGGHHDLGIHTEMFSDGLMHLVQAGVVTGKKKTLLPKKHVTSFAMGTQALYDWVNRHPVIEFRASDFTNDPFTIARNDKMIAINSAISVDLTGQVQADTLGGRFYSGIGGQVDFIRGAARSKGGCPIIALPSTARRGTISRIQPALEVGSGVVTSRGDVHYVATEYGVADLWGRNVRQRAEALIAIAHPDFRAELRAQACERRFIMCNTGTFLGKASTPPPILTPHPASGKPASGTVAKAAKTER